MLQEILKDYSIDKEYDCTNKVKCAGFTPLMVIVMNTGKYPELIDEIKNYTNIINVQNNIGVTALMLASRHSNTLSSLDTVKLLLELGADVNIKDNNEYIALLIVSMYLDSDSSFETFQMLVDYGSDIHTREINGQTLFMMIVQYSKSSPCYKKAIQFLIQHVNINYQDNEGRTALINAISYYDIPIETIKLLLDHGANVNYQDNEGCTALINAISYNDTPIETIKLLLDHGANVNLKTYKGHNAMTLTNDINILNLLVQYYDTYTLKEMILYGVHVKVCMDELDKRNKIEKIKILNHERVLKHIPEHDVAIRYKIGNMGYKICKYTFDGIITDELLHYLSATPDNLHEKAQEYLQF